VHLDREGLEERRVEQEAVRRVGAHDCGRAVEELVSFKTPSWCRETTRRGRREDARSLAPLLPSSLLVSLSLRLPVPLSAHCPSLIAYSLHRTLCRSRSSSSPVTVSCFV